MSVQILQGDASTALKTLPDESVNCCVTSPPYWGLRDYGTAKWAGGDAECDHIASDRYYTEKTAAKCSSDAFSEPGEGNKKRLKEGRWRESGTCTKCGAVKVDKQLGLERTPEEYVAKMVEVFREVRRVLRDDGTLWLNLGDSHNANGRKGHGTPRIGCKQGTNRASASGHDSNRPTAPDLKPKDLVGIPWMVAFALRADGWYLRQDIIWHKPNPMPESVTDRCTKAHEYIFLMSKSQRYYFDADAIKEPSSPDSHRRYARGRSDHHKWADGGPGNQSIAKSFEHMVRKSGVTPKSVKPGLGIKANESFHAAIGDLVDNRNKRSVWTVSTAPFPGAHFATFPPKLIEPCILAGCPAGGTVLDPFGGSGTVGMVAENNGRNSILIELNPKYVEMANRRTAQQNIFAGLAN